MSLIEFRRGRDQAGRWKDGQLQEEPPPPPPEPSPGGPDAGADARSFYESLIAEGSGAEPARSPRKGEAEEPPSSSLHFCPSCGTSFRDPPARHRRSTAHLLGLEARPAPPEPLHIPPSNPGYRLLLRAGWRGGGLGRGGRGRRLPVPTELRRDRSGLGWGPGPPARVTHFGPGDTAAVAGKGGSGEGSRSRSRSRSEAAERAWEIQLREYMERWDPPEPPPRAKRDPPDPS